MSANSAKVQVRSSSGRVLIRASRKTAELSVKEFTNLRAAAYSANSMEPYCVTNANTERIVIYVI